ncbi:hypothetical protein PYW08_012187 [Mythimna loreyi]|uniref:Uncharacterized protein n=1 Tax=Mythimna loreyi TaxID=667449 RepID=A0ACC2Q1C2_9NEOP|nr:hypothetical protein PYW08_012187 [Mythimna loreyi]
MAGVRSWVVAVCLILVTNVALGHIPYYNSAEPDAPTYVSDIPANKMSRETAADRLRAMRAVMEDMRVDAYIVPTADAHNSQYISPADARREWLSGLRGSSGTALVTATKALVWTDARYWTQFEVEVDGNQWTLMKQGQDLSLQDWLVSNMPEKTVVAVDPTTYTRSSWRTLETALGNVNVTLEAIYENLVDLARRRLNDGPPDRTHNDLIPLPVQYTGQQSIRKIWELLQEMNSRGASVLLLTALDDIAYTLNVRGSDIPFNPVFFSYLVIIMDPLSPNFGRVILFWHDGVLASDIRAHFASEQIVVEAKPYEDIFGYLKELSIQMGDRTIWLSNEASHAVLLAIEGGPARILSTSISPVALKKCVKNEVELRGFREAHIKDGVAVVRSLHWVERQVAAGLQVSEIDLSDQMVQFRSQEDKFMGPSFSTIAGAGENGAIIHYSPKREGPQRLIRPDDMLLVDSGGQYFEGTTDITRTRHMSGTPTDAQRMTFTRVMKGQISLATTVLPRGIMGNVIEVLARKALWDVGLNYGHGTGHGVGHFLNVHEGPIWILSGPTADDPGIAPNMIYSNEPGYYEVGEYGIRHEDLVETIVMSKDADHIRAQDLVDDFAGRGAVGFRTISLAPHQTACLDIDLLTDFEIQYLNDYHKRVLDTLGPIFLARNFTDEYEWLARECAPIARGATILFTAHPVLAGISAIVIWLGYQ